MDFVIDKEIQSLLPSLTKEEATGLEMSILETLHVDPLVLLVWNGDRVLGDGHHRHEICQRHGVPFTTRQKKVGSREAAIQWVIDNQLARRNLTDERRAYYVGREYLNAKKPHGGAMSQNETSLHTDKKIAEKHDVSEATVHRAAAFAEGVDKLSEQAKEKVLSGKAKVPKGEIASGIFCERCKRVGPRPGCNACKEARNQVKADKKTKRKAAKKEKPEAKDAFGTVLPSSCRDAYCDPWIQTTYDLLCVFSEQFRKARLIDGMQKRKAHYPFFHAKDFVDGCGFIIDYLDKLIQHLKENRPAGVCPACEGKKCSKCKMSGLIPRELYKSLKK